jgi:hypothetical protein
MPYYRGDRRTAGRPVVTPTSAANPGYSRTSHEDRNAKACRQHRRENTGDDDKGGRERDQVRMECGLSEWEDRVEFSRVRKERTPTIVPCAGPCLNLDHQVGTPQTR